MSLPTSTRWIITALLFTATVINYIDRQALSVLAPVLTKELGLSNAQYALVVQLFLGAYTVMYVGSGWLVDRLGARKAMALFVAWWSAAAVLHGWTRSAWDLGFYRLLLGLGEPGNFMVSFKVASEWFAPKERALVNGVVNAGAAVGAVVAVPVVSVVALQFGWRAAFVVTGLLGFVWLAVWLLVYRDADTLPIAAALPSPRWSEFLGSRITWALLLARFVSDPVWWFILFWLPKYLADQQGFTLAEVGMLAWLPYLAADVGSIGGGLVSGHLVKRGWPVVRARQMAMLPFVALMPLSVLIPWVSGRAPVLALICVMACCHMAWRTNLSTLTNDLYEPRVVGSVAGILAFGSGVGGMLFTQLTGWLVDHSGYGLIFFTMGCLHPVAFLIVRGLIRNERGFVAAGAVLAR